LGRIAIDTEEFLRRADTGALLVHVPDRGQRKRLRRYNSAVSRFTRAGLDRLASFSKEASQFSRDGI
jgi:hypothetical protein